MVLGPLGVSGFRDFQPVRIFSGMSQNLFQDIVDWRRWLPIPSGECFPIIKDHPRDIKGPHSGFSSYFVIAASFCTPIRQLCERHTVFNTATKVADSIGCVGVCGKLLEEKRYKILWMQAISDLVSFSSKTYILDGLFSQECVYPE